MATSPSAAPARAAVTTPPTGEQRDLRNVRWVVGVWAMVVVFAIITAARSLHVDVPLRDPNGQMFRGRLTSALVMLVALSLVDAIVRTWRARLGWRGAPGMLRSRWPLRRILLAVSGLVAYHAVYICYRNLKSWDTFNTPHDEQLLRFDKWLFLGHSPAVLLHDLLGQHDAAYFLAVIYKSFTYLVPVALVGSLAFVGRIRDGYVFLASAMWIWILGVGSYYLIPSLGPFASASSEFAGLPSTAITRTQAEYLSERAQMLSDPGAGDSFASISAFASLHVGYTCMVLFMLLYYGRRKLAIAMAVYLFLVMVSTVYFGWHFVLDDIAGVALAAICVLLGRLTIYPRGRRPDEVAAGEPAPAA